MKATDLYYPIVEPNHPEYNAVASMEIGISVRDKLAESAMIGIISNNMLTTGPDDMDGGWIARNAYTIADALLSQSNK